MRCMQCGVLESTPAGRRRRTEACDVQCGLVLSIRSTGNLINVWNRTANAVAENRDMEQYMKDMLHCDELSYVCAPH